MWFCYAPKRLDFEINLLTYGIYYCVSGTAGHNEGNLSHA